MVNLMYFVFVGFVVRKDVHPPANQAVKKQKTTTKHRNVLINILYEL
jgi:hypothetical protein